MSFINWGQEGPEQKEIRKRFEDRELFEQAMMAYARSSSAIAGAAGSGRIKPNEFVGLVDWLTIAPGGSGPNIEQDYSDFDEWETDNFSALIGVKRLVIEADSANAHVHSNLEFSNLTIQLFNSETSDWVTVWSKRLENPYYPEDNSDDFLMNDIDVTFPEISSVTKIRLSSNPGSDQTYHDWDQDSTIFRFYK